MKRKIVALSFFAALCITHNTAICMDYPGMENDYPQLQLQEPEKNPIKTVKATLQLNSLPFYSTSSTPYPNTHICFPGKPQRYIHDPLINVKLYTEEDVSYRDSVSRKITLSIPIKQLFNLRDESTIQFFTFDTNILHDSLFVTATCQRNPKKYINGKNFHQQLVLLMAEFYKIPRVPCKDHIPRLLAEQVIKQETTRGFERISQHDFTITSSIVIRHGERGCTDEKTVIQSMIKPKTKLYGNSIHQLLTQREYGSKRHQPLTTNPDRILDNCLRVIELETIAENNLLDECFSELQVNCLLTQLFIKNRIARLFIQFLLQKQLIQDTFTKPY